MSVADGTRNGLSVTEAVRIAQSMHAAGLIDFIDLSYGSRYNYPKVIGGMEQPLGYELVDSALVASAVPVPSIVVGRIKTLRQADDLIRDGVADLIGMVRATIADPDIVRKSRLGLAATVRPCIACNQGCVGGLHGPAMRIGCAVNPRAGRETVEPPEPTLESRLSAIGEGARPRVIVIGGGPSGMEAARVAATAGCHVVLYEASYALGGQLRLARRVPHRAEIGEISDWLERELDRLGVEVRRSAPMTPDELATLEAEVVVVATGSRPRRDGFQARRPTTPVPGSELPHVYTSWDVLEGMGDIRGNVIVFDDVGHYEAAGVVEHLLWAGASVTMLTSQPRLASQLASTHVDEALKRRLHLAGLRFVPDVALTSISQGAVTWEGNWGGGAETASADAVVLVSHNVATGDAVRDAVRHARVDVIGDALSPRFLQVAIAEGRRAGFAAANVAPAK
jgi:NADPH-dependent 2,4-dienoyl-CoA reductase/sulfur reductase-like enzyme